jgi:hypothetical protein
MIRHFKGSLSRAWTISGAGTGCHKPTLKHRISGKEICRRSFVTYDSNTLRLLLGALDFLRAAERYTELVYLVDCGVIVRQMPKCVGYLMQPFLILKSTQSAPILKPSAGLDM